MVAGSIRCQALFAHFENHIIGGEEKACVFFDSELDCVLVVLFAFQPDGVPKTTNFVLETEMLTICTINTNNRCLQLSIQICPCLDRPSIHPQFMQ